MSDDPLKQTPAVELDRDNEAARWRRAHQIACENVTELNDHNTKVTEALAQAMMLLDQLMTEMRLANVIPSAAIIFTKAEFDRKMRILLGKKQGTTQDDRDGTTGSGPGDCGGITG